MTETANPWVLVPREIARDMRAAMFDAPPRTIAQDWDAALSAVPPIPRDVFEQMVERGARATFLSRNGSKTCWAWDSSALDDEHPGARERYLQDAETALRAALGQKVDGDE